MKINSNFDTADNPIIVLGMHRSGTAMIVKVLENLGVFMGADKEHNGESTFYLKLNDWLLRQGSCSWDKPANLDPLLKDSAMSELLIDYLKFYVRSPLVIRYKGIQKFFGYNKMQEHWGWKDPRNTYTLRFWLKLYPNARVIIVERNGLDVAQSLDVRRKKYLQRSVARFSWIKYIHLLRPAREPFGTSGILSDINRGIDLWHKYLSEGRMLQRELVTKCHVLKYEDFLEKPMAEIISLSNFLDIDVNKTNSEAIKEVINSLDVSRAYANVPEDFSLSVSSVKKLAEYEL